MAERLRMLRIALGLVLVHSAFAQLPPSTVLSGEDMNGVRAEIARLESLAATAPDRCAVVTEIARTWAFAGQYPETMAALEKVVALHAGFDIGRDSVFAKL